MNQPGNNKRREGTAGVKALIAAAAVAATVAGWALLPANDPPVSAATDPPTGPAEFGLPGGAPSDQGTGAITAQPINPQTTLPQVTTPRGFARQPFARSHSSR